MEQKSKKVLFLVPYPVRHAPSQRFRVELYEDFLKEATIIYKVVPFMNEATWSVLYKGGSTIKKLYGILLGYLKRWATVLVDVPRYDYIFVHREAAPLGPPIFEWVISKVLQKKMIYDFDDAIWIANTSSENKIAAWGKAFWKVKWICKWSYKVAVGNKYLFNYAAQFNQNVTLLPTCVDVEKRHNEIKVHSAGKVVIGWTGSQTTLFYLDELMPALKKLEQHYDFTFLVIANRNPELALKGFAFVRWSENTEIEDLLQIDIGVMPLIADKWSEGKCGFKLIQYMALGIPAIANPVGVNKEIISNEFDGLLASDENEWVTGLQNLMEHPSLRSEMGHRGREKIVNKYSIQSQKQHFLDLFS